MKVKGNGRVNPCKSKNRCLVDEKHESAIIGNQKRSCSFQMMDAEPRGGLGVSGTEVHYMQSRIIE